MSSGKEDPRLVAAKRADQLLSIAGAQLRTERERRRWTLAKLADRARVSRAAASAAENGDRGSLEMIVALGGALGLSVELDLVDRRQKDRAAKAARAEDPVHAAMGELEVRHLRQFGFPMAIDEPYQHYQFAGRADVLAWSIEGQALLHLENRTQFPNYQEAIGAFNAKRAYLAAEIAERLGLRPFLAETHVMVCLWSAEMLHALRLRQETFRATCRDPANVFRSWWSGTPPPRGRTSTLVVLDPFAEGRQPPWIDLETALSTARPRMKGYAEAATLISAGRSAHAGTAADAGTAAGAGKGAGTAAGTAAVAGRGAGTAADSGTAARAGTRVG